MGWASVLKELPASIGRPATRTAYFPQVDGLRFIAIIIVVVWHASLRAARYIEASNHQGRGPSIDSLYGLFPHGEIGVALFFLISGFVIAQPVVNGGLRSFGVLDFYKRRIRRLYPPYLIALTGCLLLVLATGFQGRDDAHVTVWQSYAASAFYLNGLVINQPSLLDPPLWSLELEIQFYLLFPLLAAIYFGRESARDRLLLAALLVLALVVASAFTGALGRWDSRFRFGLITYAPLFLGGIVAADVVQSGRAAAALTPRRYDLLAAAGLILLLGIGYWFTQIDARPTGLWQVCLASGGLLLSSAGIFFGALYGRWAAAVTAHPWIRLLGTMCFSIYLVHIVAVEGLSKLVLQRIPMSNAAGVYLVHLLVLVPVSLLVGVGFYLAVERPFMNRASRSRVRSRTAVPSEA